MTFTVGELPDGEVRGFPDLERNDARSDTDSERFVSVQSVVVDPADRLWVLDTGSPMFADSAYGGPKLVCIDLDTDEVVQTILFDEDVALPSTYLNDVRFDLRRGEAGAAFITDSSDSGPNGIIAVGLASGHSWRRLHDHRSTKALTPPELRMVIEGEQWLERSEDGSTSPITMGADGIAIAADGSRLYYCPLAGRRWYSVESTRCSTATRTTSRWLRPSSTKATRAASVTAWRPTTEAGPRHRRRARRRPPPAAGRQLGDRRARPAAALAGHDVRRGRRTPVRHREPAVPARQVPRRRR